MLVVRENRILSILQAQGRSIYWLAKQVEMSYQSIHRLAKSPSIPEGTSYGTLRRVSRVLDVSVDDLEEEK